MSTPTPLDAPFTAEDRPLSVWSTSGERRVGTFELVSSAYERMKHKRGEHWPVQPSKGQPIGIQLVRGAFGAGNEWALVVDGVTCHELVANDDATLHDYSTVATCQLPPPFPYTEPIGEDTVVRPIAITVRLEEEGLAPESVHVVLQQVVHSEERSSQSPKTEKEVITIERIALPTHTSRDAVAPAMVLPYPFAAPPQSALGIVSYREVNKYFENVAYVEDYNADRKQKHEEKLNSYRSDEKKFNDDKRATQKLNISKRAKYQADRLAWIANGSPPGQEPTAPTYTKTRKWTKAPPPAPSYKTPPSQKPSDSNNSTSFVIGGSGESSARGLVAIYDKLTALCERLKKEFKGQAVPQIIEKMRVQLSVTNSRVELAFLETLLSGFPSPWAVKQTKIKLGDYNVLDDDAGDNAKQTAKKNTSQFVYDYVPFAKRQLTYTTLRIVLEITEYTGQRKLVALESKPYDGKAAHAVYSGFVDDVKQLEDASAKFRACLQDVQNGASLLKRTASAANEIVQTRDFKPKYKQIENIVNEVNKVHKFIVPVWPEPLSMERYNDLLQTLGDQGTSSEVLERMRQASSDGTDEDFFGTEEEQNESDDEASESGTKGQEELTQQYIRDAKSLGVKFGDYVPVTSVARLVTRELPQVARPLREVAITFQTPTDMAPPDQSALSVDTSDSFLVKSGAAIMGVVVGLTKFSEVKRTADDIATAAALSGLFEGLATRFAGTAFLGALAPWAAWAPFAVGLASVGSIALNFAVNVVSAEGQAWTSSLPAGWSAYQSIMSFSRWFNSKNGELDVAYEKAARAALGVPIASSVAAGQSTFRLIRDRARKAQLSLASNATVAVLYDVSNNTRYYFQEYYKPTSESVELLSKLPMLHKVDTWARVPDTTALLMLPPGDVAASVYEAEVLRRLPFGSARERTVGVPEAIVATTPAEIAAKAAHRELLGLVRAGRFPFVPMSGEQLLLSFSATVVLLSKAAAKLIQAAYGSSAGLTLVDGADAIWSCLPAGVAARIAVRHMGIFTDAEPLAGERTLEQLQKLQKHWRKPRRAIMDEFADALVKEATAAASVKNDDVPQLAKNATEAAHAFERVRVLSNVDDAVGLLVVVAAFSSVLLVRDERTLARVLDNIASAEPDARSFLYQARLEPPPPAAAAQRALATWASRRLDIQPIKQLGRENSPTGVDDLLKSFGQLEVADRASGTAAYYCPIGSRVEGLPGQVPFGVEDLSQRPVWVHAMGAAALQLSRSLLVQSGDALITVHATVVPDIGDGPGGLEGYARHPLAVTVNKDGIVETYLSQMPRAEAEAPPVVRTIVQAVEELKTSAPAGKIVRQRLLRMRSLAYNADRLQNAVDLAVSGAEGMESIDVDLPHAASCVSLSIAMALLVGEQRPVAHVVQIYLPSGEERNAAREALMRVHANCAAALERGCKVAKLAEVCAALA